MPGTTTPISPLLPFLSPVARPFGTYPSCVAAFMTLALVAALIRGWLLNAFDTAEGVMPKWVAMSTMVAFLFINSVWIPYRTFVSSNDIDHITDCPQHDNQLRCISSLFKSFEQNNLITCSHYKYRSNIRNFLRLCRFLVEFGSKSFPKGFCTLGF